LLIALAAITPAYTGRRNHNCFQTTGANIGGASNLKTSASPRAPSIANGGGHRHAPLRPLHLMANIDPSRLHRLHSYKTGLSGLLGEIGSVPRQGNRPFLSQRDWQKQFTRPWATSSQSLAGFLKPEFKPSPASPSPRTASETIRFVTLGASQNSTPSFTSTLSNEARFQTDAFSNRVRPSLPRAYETATFLHPHRRLFNQPAGLPRTFSCTNCFDMGVPTFLSDSSFP